MTETTAPSPSIDAMTDKARDVRDRAASSAKDYKNKIGSGASDLSDSASDAAQDAIESVNEKTGGLRDTAASLAAGLKDQASSHVDEARGVISAMADEARHRVADIIDQQKALGADKLTSLSRAAQNAAEDLDGQNPHVARLVRDAAGSVDRIAGDLRSSSLNDVIASVTTFARRQPVAFFAGSVLAGFALARFLKSEPTAGTVGDGPSSRS